MTGAEHFAEAEQRLRAADYKWQDTCDVVTALGALYEATMAQASATLALAAATVHNSETGFARVGEYGDVGVPA